MIKNNPFVLLSILLAAAVSGVTFVFSWRAALIELSFVLTVTFFIVSWYKKATKCKIEEVTALGRVLKTGQDGMEELLSFPFPTVLARADGSIVWFNHGFEAVLEDLGGLDNRTLYDILPGIPSDNAPLSPFEIKGEKGEYTVYTSAVRASLNAYYLVENTELKQIRTRFHKTRPVAVLVHVDSLEQAEDLLPHEEYYSLLSETERIITKWLVEYNCVFRKFSDGRFLAVTEHENLTRMIQNKFSVLDTVRQSHIGSNDLDLTLSVGVGAAQTFKQSEDGAREALDMARGRGGDQAAVKAGDDYSFFGGISSGTEKRGKVKSRAFAAALDSYMERHDTVLLMGHRFGDFDCVGACVGIYAIAKAKGKRVHIVVNRQTSLAMPLINALEADKSVSFVSPKQALTLVKDNPLLIVTDTMRQSLTEEPKLLGFGLKTVVIDHHRRNAQDVIECSYPEFMEPAASSASEMVTELVQYSPAKPVLTPVMAQALLAGITLDTKDFALRAGKRTFEAATYLREMKADTVKVRKLFSIPAEERFIINKTVNACKLFNGYAVSRLDYTGSDARLIAAKAADEMLYLQNTDASFVLVSDEKGTHISARSLGVINVQLIMEELNGGGHHAMAATQLTGVNAEEAEKRLLDAIEKHI